MTARAFTDDWDGLKVYDDEWELHDAGEILANTELYEDLQRKSGMLPERGLTVPQHVLFEVTGACNLNCSFCYNASGEGTPSLSDEEFVDAIAQIVELDTLEVIITGGEPLVRPDAVRAAVETFEHFGIAVQILTNGLRVDREWADYFLEHGVLSVQVSIDGADPEGHDEVRGKQGAWRSAVEAVGTLSSSGCFTIMAVVLTQQNHETLDDYIELAFAIGADQVMIGDVMPRGRGVESLNDVRITDDQYVDAVRRLRAKARQYEGMMQVTLASDEALALKMLLARTPSSLVVRTDGSVTASCLLPVPLGNIEETPLRTIWSESVANMSANPQVREFVAPLRVRGVGEESLLRVDHEAFTGPGGRHG
ncbi:MAG: radical SAM/SPASM domain-containing protein [Armatimonadota bacterium]